MAANTEKLFREKKVHAALKEEKKFQVMQIN